MKIEQPTTITVDGKEYAVESFSPAVQQLVAIHTQWRRELVKERLAVSKTEAAIRGVDVELAQTVAKELAPAPAPETPAPTAVDGPTAENV